MESHPSWIKSGIADQSGLSRTKVDGPASISHFLEGALDQVAQFFVLLYLERAGGQFISVGRRKGQAFTADSVVKHTPVRIADAEFPFEHLPHPLAERELIHLGFDRRFLAAQQALHKPTVADLSCGRPELERACRYQAEHNSSFYRLNNSGLSG
jgi:hypothetical protein